MSYVPSFETLRSAEMQMALLEIATKEFEWTGDEWWWIAGKECWQTLNAFINDAERR